MSRKFEIINNKVENVADETVFRSQDTFYADTYNIYVINFTEMSK